MEGEYASGLEKSAIAGDYRNAESSGRESDWEEQNVRFGRGRRVWFSVLLEEFTCKIKMEIHER